MSRYGKLWAVLSVAVLVTLAVDVAATTAEVLEGAPGSSAQWGSGWIDLKKQTSLHKGDLVRVHVGGTAKKVLVRFLEDLNQADKPVGIEGGIREVPADRVVEVAVQGEHAVVRQISVHGNPQAWTYSLGTGNGPATLESVEVVRPK